MAMFKYRAVDEHGESVQGEMEAGSAQQVTTRLQERGLTVNDVTERDRHTALVRVSQQLTWEELNIFVEQLRAIVRGGLPLAPALKALASDFSHARLKSVLDGIHKDIESGTSLEDAIERRREAFPPLVPHVIRAGESTGNLAGVLELLSRYSDRMIRFRERLKVALAYPIFVSIAALGVLYFLMLKVIPMFAEIFEEFGGELPAPTRFWVGMSRWFQGNATVLGTLLIIAVLLVFLVPRFLRRTDSGSVLLDSLRYRLPSTGQSHYLSSMSQFSRTLSLLLGAGVPILESMRLSAAASGSPLLHRRLDEAAVRVAGGERLSDALGDTDFVRHDFCWLVAMGEDRGELVYTLESAADTYDRQLEAHDQMFFGLLGPAVVVFLALLIGSVIVALYLPIFTLGDQVSGV